MPTYDIRVVETGEEKEVFCSISEKEEKIASGEWEQLHKATAELVTHVNGTLSTTSDGWKDLLKQTKRYSGRGNTIKI